MRFREDPGVSNYGSYDWDMAFERNTQYDWNVSASPLKHRTYRSMWDIVVPNFKERSAKGEIFNNAMFSQTFQEGGTPLQFTREGTIDIDGTPETFNQRGIFTLHDKKSLVMTEFPETSHWHDIDDHFDDYDTLASQAVSAAWANIDESEIQGLASLGEMPETLRWIASLFQRAINLARLYKSKQVKASLLRSLRRSTKADAADAISDIWLEFRYAFRPLVFEMTQALTALETNLDKGSRRTARGWKEEKTTTNVSDRVIHDANWNYLLTHKTRVHYRARAGVLYDISSDIRDLKSVWGFDQPFESIYELTPWSFVLDWFFNVGDIISSWAVGAGLSPLSSWVMEDLYLEEVMTARSLVCNDADSGVISSLILSEVPGEYKATALYKLRTPSPQRAILPSFNLNLNVGKITDLAALGYGVVRSMRR